MSLFEVCVHLYVLRGVESRAVSRGACVYRHFSEQTQLVNANIVRALIFRNCRSHRPRRLWAVLLRV